MSKLVALVFDDPYKADEARAAVRRMAGEGLLDLEESALVIKDADGKLRVAQDENAPAKSQKIGHVIGLIGAAVTGIFPVILGATVAGRLLGRLTDHGVTNRFLNDVKTELQLGTSALVVYAQSDPERRKQIIERLQPFSPKVLQSDLPPEVAEEIRRAFEDASAAG